MLVKNPRFLFIRCNKYQFLVKKGSISNFSFDIIDENKNGFLEYAFEIAKYPQEEEAFIQGASTQLGMEREEVISELNKLYELEIIEKAESNQSPRKTLLVYNEDVSEEVRNEMLKTQEPDAAGRITGYGLYEYEDPLMITTQDAEKEFGKEKLRERVKSCDVVLVVASCFMPTLFYQMNALCIENEKPIVISYLDGDEGVIVPLKNPARYGCYNDFELLREASFHNLLNYQVMKETLIKEDIVHREFNQMYLKLLILYTMIIANQLLSHSMISSYCYSLDCERMVFSKTKLMRFPNCPSCQGDLNISHPFI